MVKAPELGYANIGMVMLIEKKKKRHSSTRRTIIEYICSFLTFWIFSNVLNVFGLLC